MHLPCSVKKTSTRKNKSITADGIKQSIKKTIQCLGLQKANVIDGRSINKNIRPIPST